MKLSIVSTLYLSKPFLEEFLQEIKKAIELLKIKNYEIVFVNDGSPDDSLEFLLSKKKEYPEIKIIDLSRNFGHHYAIQAGLENTSGEYVFLIDNDLEVHPNFIIQCFDTILKNNSIDVVYGYQEKRKGSFVENIGGKIFWWGINQFSETRTPYNLLTERLMKRKYVDSLLKLGDVNLFLGGMMSWVGFNQLGIPVKKGLREGKSTYSTKKRMELMISAITSFSGKPLEYLFYFGISITSLSFIGLIALLINKIIFNDSIQLGWTSLIIVNVMILGIISMFLGIVGVYLFKIFRQVQNRPNFIIKNIYD